MHVLYDDAVLLADDVTVADTLGAKLRGWIGRTDVGHDEALVFPFEKPRTRRVHMLGVRTEIGVLWVRDGVITQRAVLEPWTGYDAAVADTVIECHPHVAEQMAAGDPVTVRNPLTF